MQNPKSNLKYRIANVLLLNASFINNIGLMHGKMGISIFFYHLARETNNNLYEEFAGELLDDIYKEINKDIGVNFENGISGIGWGIEYLIQNQFVTADTNEVLAEIDNYLFTEFTNKGSIEINLLTGSLGTVIYSIQRIKNVKSISNTILYKESHKEIICQFIVNLERIFDGVKKQENSFRLYNFLWDINIILYVLI
jgi:lantibiotic modifying enzyme